MAKNPTFPLVGGFDFDGTLHRPQMKIAVIGKGPGMGKEVFEPLPRFVEGEPTIKFLPPTRTISPPTRATGDGMGFLCAIGINPDDFFSRLDRHLLWAKKGGSA